MPKRKKSARSLSAKRGWVTRRKREAAEFKLRSKAAKKGWRRRKAKAKIKEKAKAQPKARKGRLREWIVTWTYHVRKGAPRVVDFIVIARTESDAELYVVKAVDKGEDSTGADLTWMTQIPWDTVETVPGEENDGEENRAEIKKLGAGYVEMR